MTKRERLYPEIKRLREVEGLMWREIGERVGLSLKIAQQYYSDPDGSKAASRKSASDQRLKQVCPRCGNPMGLARDGIERCQPCYWLELQRAHQAKLDDVQQLWEEGASYRDIAAYLGYGPNSQPPELTQLRKLGRIGYRNRGYGRVAA